MFVRKISCSLPVIAMNVKCLLVNRFTVHICVLIFFSSLCVNANAHINDSARIHLVDEIVVGGSFDRGQISRPGFDVGLFHSFFRDKRMNILVGGGYST